jgi:hypothetical protein
VLRALRLPAWGAAGLIVAGAGLVTVLIASRLLMVGVRPDRLLPPLIGFLAVAALGAGAVRNLGRLRIPAADTSSSLLTRDLLGMAFWSLLLWGGTEALQWSSGHVGNVWPLKARVNPMLAPLVALPIALFGIWLALLLWQLRAADRAAGEPGPGALRRPASLLPLAFVLISAVILPVVLKGAVRGWDTLYVTFRDSAYEYQHDVPLVSDPLTLLRQYVALAPTLSLHTSTHPPGSLLLLWGLVQIFGPGAVATSWAAIILSSLGALAAFWLGWRLGGPAIAALAGALFVVMPGHQVYSVTSMDAVFTAILALGAVSFLLALEPGARPGLAMLSGGLIALGLFFTYTATQMVFFGLAVFAVAVTRGYAQTAGGPRGLARAAAHPLRQSLLGAGTITTIYALVWLLTGFNLPASIHAASAINSTVMNGVDTSDRLLSFLPLSLAFYTDYLGANLLPYLWYLAPWGLTALSALLLTSISRERRPGMLDSATIGLAGVVAGMWLSGIFIREVERIWAFTYPLAAVLIACHVWQGPTQRVRLWRAGLFAALFIAQSVFIRVMFYTYW